MALHHAVPGVLAAKPADGYELRGSFEEAGGEQRAGWTPGTCTRSSTG